MIATTHETLAGPKDIQKMMSDDPEWQALLKEHNEKQYAVLGSLDRHIYEVIE